MGKLSRRALWGTILTVVPQFALGIVPKDWVGDGGIWGSYAALFMALFGCWLLATPGHDFRRAMDAMLETIVKDFFDNDNESHRITFFKDSPFRAALWRWFWRVTWHGIAHARKGIYGDHLKDFPRPFRRFLTIQGRGGQPHKDGTTTFFMEPESEDELCGAATEAWYSEEIKKHENLVPPKGAAASDEKFKAYARSSGMAAANDLKNIRKLRTLHRWSRHFYAIPIYDGKGQINGVLVIDSDAKESPFKSSSFEKNMALLVRIIEKVGNCW